MRPSVAIIGGGIGGLFAANALIAQGLRVSVYEQASALGEVGAGVFVTPNAVRQLERVGLGRRSRDGALASARLLVLPA
jgi:salicylate hydroxylase